LVNPFDQVELQNLVTQAHVKRAPTNRWKIIGIVGIVATLVLVFNTIISYRDQITFKNELQAIMPTWKRLKAEIGELRVEEAQAKDRLTVKTADYFQLCLAKKNAEAEALNPLVVQEQEAVNMFGRRIKEKLVEYDELTVKVDLLSRAVDAASPWKFHRLLPI
jgi:hypothetical protein